LTFTFDIDGILKRMKFTYNVDSRSSNISAMFGPPVSEREKM
jgi:hypothetical protein